MKRLADFFLSLAGLIASSPVLVPAMLAIWLQDFQSPLYVADRVGKDGKIFRMKKLRSMVVRADRTGVDSTAANDPRITPVGRFVRKCKLDELPQLWNVLMGEMSLVGPRPNVKRETDLYTDEEKKLLSVRPGITDFASLVFADEGDILKGSPDPDLDYNRLIRPWKSRLGLHYVTHRTLLLDLRLVVLTLVAALDRRRALDEAVGLLQKQGADEMLRRMAARREPLLAWPPPGASEVVKKRAPAGACGCCSSKEKAYAG